MILVFAFFRLKFFLQLWLTIKEQVNGVFGEIEVSDIKNYKVIP